VLDLSLIKFSINSRGKLDPFIVSYICEQMNKKFSLQLFSLIFLNLDSPEKNAQNHILTSHFTETLFQIYANHPGQSITRYNSSNGLSN